MNDSCYYDPNQFTILQLNCTNCNLIDNINISNSMQPNYIQKISNTFLCRHCLNIEENSKNINFRVNRIVNKNKEIHSSLTRELKNVKNEYVELLLKENKENKEKFLSIEEFLKFKNKKFLTIEEYLNFKNKDDFQNRIIELDKNLQNINDRKKTEEKILSIIKNDVGCLQIKINDKLLRKSKHISKVYNSQQDFIKVLSNNIIDIEKKQEEIIKLIDNKYNDILDENIIKLKAIRDEIDGLRVGRKEYKEMKHLKSKLILNDKEYKKLKTDINNFNEGIIYIKYFIGLNILSILTFIIHTVIFYK